MPETTPAGAYAIATPHVAATAAGRAAFEAGGNAIDAALAAACTLTVVYPHMCAVGGDVMALVHDGQAHAVNGSGRAPAALRPGPVPLRGVGSITVPGAVRAWETLAGRWGSRPLSQALVGAAALAHDGVGVAPSLGRTIVDCRALIAADAGLSAVFAPGGRLLAEGETLVQHRLGATLERLAERGADDLYAGETGAMLVAGLRDLNAPLAGVDLEAHRTEVSSALRCRVGGDEYLTMGPNSQGYVLPQIMAVAERVRLSDPFGHGAPMLSAIFALAAADRDAHLADPAAMRVDVADLLADTHVAELADQAVGIVGVPAAWPRATGDTIALVAADGSGLAVSLIQSIFYGFGSGVLEPSTGILCHNRGACFSADPESPNAPAPGKRPLHTLMPLVVERDGRVRWVAGTMGGHAQPQIHAQLLLRRRAGADAQAAVAAPRFIVGDEEPGAAIAVEEGFASALEAFTDWGATPIAIPAGSGLVGHAHAIAIRDDGSFDAGSDPRADGAAATGA
jgi:gamma-glutamyltranspeptidase/glutathione hydrolase